MINASKDYYYPGMSGAAIRSIYGSGFIPINDNIICRPKEDVVFNEDMFFMASDKYIAEEKENTITVACMDGLALTGIVHLDKETFDKYFVREES